MKNNNKKIDWKIAKNSNISYCMYGSFNRYAITVWYMDKKEREQARLDFFQEGKYGVVLFFVCL